jgi:hypothetical protein
MKFGVREICDVVFKANQTVKIGDITFKRGQPVLYIDTAKTSTIEGAASTVYATGGKGNSRLIAWEGEKTLTFTVEDALLSEVGFAILSGAGLFNLTKENARIHTTEIVYANGDGLGLEYLPAGDSPIFVMKYENGSIGRKVTGFNNATAKSSDGLYYINGTGLKEDNGTESGVAHSLSGQYFVDYYRAGSNTVTELNIDAENFAGYYYVEASTLFRRESDGKDLPAEIVFPKVKIQSNFTFNMASTGDPSTFTFTMDAMPAYTMFEKTKKVLCAIQVVDDTLSVSGQKEVTTLVGDEKAILEGEDGKVLNNDSVTETKNN